jgi:hypothetical protein
MDLSVLLLDDKQSKMWSALMRALRPFYDREPAFPESWDDRLPEKTLKLKNLLEEPVELNVFWNPKGALGQDTSDWLRTEWTTKGRTVDMILVDDQWDDGEFYGQDVLLAEVFAMTSYWHRPKPLICLCTQHWEMGNATRTDRFAELLRREPFWGSNRLSGLAKDDEAALRILLQRAVAERLLWLKMSSLEQVAHGPYELPKYTRGLMGIDDVVIALARKLEAFSMWRSQELDELPVELRDDFPSCIMLEGEPGCGKSSIASAVVEALQATQFDFTGQCLPTDKSNTWKAPLQTLVQRAYMKAQSKEIAVIVVDDIPWIALEKIGDEAIRAQWREFYHTLRDYIKDAALINEGKRPEIIRFPSEASVLGKILWLVARNTDEMIGKMFEPLRDIMVVVPVVFPRGVDERLKILKHKSASRGFSFDEEAIRLAVSNTLFLGGRELTGDSQHGRGGMLGDLVALVRERERARLRAGTHDFDFAITVGIVRQWLQGLEYKSMLVRRTNQGWINAPVPEHAGVAIGIHYRDGYDDIRTKLDLDEQMIREGKSPNERGGVLYPQAKESTRTQCLASFYDKGKTPDTFHRTPESDARLRWPNVLLDIVMHRKKKLEHYPQYVQKYK